MKNLLLIIGLVLLSNIAFSQYSKGYNPPKGWGEVELWLPVSTLVGTFTTVQGLGGNITLKQRSTIAATGMATSVITHFVFRKIRESKKSNKKLIVFNNYKHKF